LIYTHTDIFIHTHRHLHAYTQTSAFVYTNIFNHTHRHFNSYTLTSSFIHTDILMYTHTLHHRSALALPRCSFLVLHDEQQPYIHFGIYGVLQSLSRSSFLVFRTQITPTGSKLGERQCNTLQHTATHMMNNNHIYIYIQHIELPAKLLDYFLRSDKSNINQSHVYV